MAIGERATNRKAVGDRLPDEVLYLLGSLELPDFGLESCYTRFKDLIILRVLLCLHGQGIPRFDRVHARFGEVPTIVNASGGSIRLETLYIRNILRDY